VDGVARAGGWCGLCVDDDKDEKEDVDEGVKEEEEEEEEKEGKVGDTLDNEGIVFVVHRDLITVVVGIFDGFSGDVKEEGGGEGVRE
jgi:hypothetical protein